MPSDQLERMARALACRDMEAVRVLLDSWRDAGLGFAAIKGLLQRIEPGWQNADVEELLEAVEIVL